MGFLAKSSEYFRNYIEHGLKSIESEANHSNGGHRVLADSTSSRSAIDNNSTNSAGSGGSVYKISATSESYSSRGYATLTSSETETESTSSTLTAGSQSQSNNPADNPPDVDAIRKRLERIKQSAF